jgi:transcriptional antiterminator Rof (Rho-off)
MDKICVNVEGQMIEFEVDRWVEAFCNAEYHAKIDYIFPTLIFIISPFAYYALAKARLLELDKITRIGAYYQGRLLIPSYRIKGIYTMEVY